jgi:hypothetical protein
MLVDQVEVRDGGLDRWNRHGRAHDPVHLGAARRQDVLELLGHPRPVLVEGRRVDLNPRWRTEKAEVADELHGHDAGVVLRDALPAAGQPVDLGVEKATARNRLWVNGVAPNLEERGNRRRRLVRERVAQEHDRLVAVHHDEGNRDGGHHDHRNRQPKPAA